MPTSHTIFPLRPRLPPSLLRCPTDRGGLIDPAVSSPEEGTDQQGVQSGGQLTGPAGPLAGMAEAPRQQGGSSTYPAEKSGTQCRHGHQTMAHNSKKDPQSSPLETEPSIRPYGAQQRDPLRTLNQPPARPSTKAYATELPCSCEDYENALNFEPTQESHGNGDV